MILLLLQSKKGHNYQSRLARVDRSQRKEANKVEEFALLPLHEEFGSLIVFFFFLAS